MVTFDLEKNEFGERSSHCSPEHKPNRRIWRAPCFPSGPSDAEPLPGKSKLRLWPRSMPPTRFPCNPKRMRKNGGHMGSGNPEGPSVSSVLPPKKIAARGFQPNLNSTPNMAHSSRWSFWVSIQTTKTSSLDSFLWSVLFRKHRFWNLFKWLQEGTPEGQTGPTERLHKSLMTHSQSGLSNSTHSAPGWGHWPVMPTSG